MSARQADLRPAVFRVLLLRGRGSARGCTSNERLLLLDRRPAAANRSDGFCASSPLGKGRVTDDGCPQCPSHAAMYDVGTGAMVRSPQGAFKPLAAAVKATTGAPGSTPQPRRLAHHSY